MKFLELLVKIQKVMNAYAEECKGKEKKLAALLEELAEIKKSENLPEHAARIKVILEETKHLLQDVEDLKRKVFENRDRAMKLKQIVDAALAKPETNSKH